MKIKNNRFDETSHSYYVTENGVERRLPSVTQVLADLLPCWSASEWHLNRGRVVHCCAAMIARGVEFEHDPAIDGQVKACKRFFEECKPYILYGMVESKFWSFKYKFAGTLDLAAVIGNKTAIIDWKASFSAALPYQLAAYSILVQECLQDGGIHYGYGVQLNEDGTYRMSEVYDLRRYKTGFLNMLGTYNIRRECKVKTEGTQE